MGSTPLSLQQAAPRTDCCSWCLRAARQHTTCAWRRGIRSLMQRQHYTRTIAHRGRSPGCQRLWWGGLLPAGARQRVGRRQRQQVCQHLHRERIHCRVDVDAVCGAPCQAVCTDGGQAGQQGSMGSIALSSRRREAYAFAAELCSHPATEPAGPAAAQGRRAGAAGETPAAAHCITQSLKAAWATLPPSCAQGHDWESTATATARTARPATRGTAAGKA